MSIPLPTAAHEMADALLRAGLVDPTRRDEAATVVAAVLATDGPGPQPPAAPLRRRFSEIAGYVGAAFVVGAAALFFGNEWQGLGRIQQIALLATATIVLVAGGLAVSLTTVGPGTLRSPGQDLRRRLASVLFTGGGLAAAFTSGLVLTRPHVSDLAGSALLLAALVGTVVVAVGYRLAPSVVGQVGTAVGVVCTVSGALELAHSVDSDPWFGLAVLSLGVGWLLLVERGVWRERQAGQLVAGALALVGAQYSVFGDHALLAYVATGLLALAAFAGYVARSSWPYLATGVLAATLVVPEALTDWTEGSVGSAGGLLAAGVTLLAASLLGLSLRRGAAEH